jgi:Ca2+-binding EF-hand superfamily protein
MSQQFLKEKRTRTWMGKHGKNHLLDFSDDELKKLKECFLSLDDDGSGSIGVDELETPLIGLGFADTREEIQEMVNEVDAD